MSVGRALCGNLVYRRSCPIGLLFVSLKCDRNVASYFKVLSKISMKKKSLTPLNEFIDKKVGKKGTKKRDKFEAGYEAFKLGVLIQEARQKKGLTQEQVAELSGTNKSYISKLEKDLKDVRFSTLQRIITEGLGAHLEISIKF